MNTIDEILGMICTEAVEDIILEDSEEENLPKMRYDLRLVRYDNGSYEWLD